MHSKIERILVNLTLPQNQGNLAPIYTLSYRKTHWSSFSTDFESYGTGAELESLFFFFFLQLRWTLRCAEAAKSSTNLG